MSSPAVQALRGIGCGRLLVGAVTLVAAGRGGVPVIESLPPRAVVAARLLAVRDLVQGAALVSVPKQHLDRAALSGGVVDSLHAASMLALIICSRRYRSAATLSAASALAWIAATVAARAPASQLDTPGSLPATGGLSAAGAT
jgi:hypothetical protein